MEMLLTTSYQKNKQLIIIYIDQRGIKNDELSRLVRGKGMHQ